MHDRSPTSQHGGSWGFNSSVLWTSSSRLRRKRQRGEMHILQVPAESLWGRKLKLMGKLWLSFIHEALSLPLARKCERGAVQSIVVLRVLVTLLKVSFSGFRLTLVTGLQLNLLIEFINSL